jgi:hypothetical protein
MKNLFLHLSQEFMSENKLCLEERFLRTTKKLWKVHAFLYFFDELSDVFGLRLVVGLVYFTGMQVSF